MALGFLRVPMLLNKIAVEWKQISFLLKMTTTTTTMNENEKKKRKLWKR